MDVPFWLWAVFGAVVVGGLTIDLVAHRGAKTIGFKEAAVWSGVWVGLSIAFAVVVGVVVSPDAALSFGTAWLLEKSLSVDNLFVFALIFGYFKVPRAYQHRVLFFGVIGALVFRGIFLALGVAVVEQFTAILFVFAAILLFSAWKLMRGDDDSFDPGSSRAVRLLRRVVPVRDEYAGTKFFVREAGRRVATPLLAVVVAIEAADLVFAVDSVPAVLAVSSETFIVYTSNAFAILGLRALYFLLSGMLERFHLLSKGLAIILGFIGVKLLLQAAHETISTSVPEIPTLVSLGVIVVVLTASVVGSLARPAPAVEHTDDEPAEPAEPARPVDHAGER
ncbi:TerC family protein [Angustibacter aerolatus]